MLLKVGVKSPEVKQLQLNLSCLDERLKCDGYYGSKTESAVERYQQRNRIAIDGTVHGFLFARIAREANSSPADVRGSTIPASGVPNFGVNKIQAKVPEPKPKKKTSSRSSKDKS